MSAFSDMSGMSTSSGPGVFSMDSGPSLFSPQPSGPAPPVPQQQHEVNGGQFYPNMERQRKHRPNFSPLKMVQKIEIKMTDLTGPPH